MSGHVPEQDPGRFALIHPRVSGWRRILSRRRSRRSANRFHTVFWNTSVSQPASAMPTMLTPSCSALPRTSVICPNARPSATLPAAGTVVTEMKTPASPPTRADVSDSTPAAPAMTATMNDHLSGV